jgi:hypothetical protein
MAGAINLLEDTITALMKAQRDLTAASINAGLDLAISFRVNMVTHDFAETD